ncbi:MAG TPA: HlyD family efflux transporter periplasmic adaptor subunit [Methyloceanibacter sp.]|nr:HlyD family efflux transporter periplasmic adaptor subunit [Methyloceanibacter sp.]
MVRIVGGILTGLFLIAATLFVYGCGDPQTNEFPGYMEAHLVLVGSEQGGRVEILSVEEGDSVEKGMPIFTLESTEQEAEVAAARTRVTEAEARLADAKQHMQRPGEIEVLEAALAQAKAMLVQSNLTLDRTQRLFDKHWVSQAQLDDAQAQHDRNEAAVAEAEKRIAAANLPNRSDLIDAAAASVETSRHSLEQAEKALAKRKVFAPAAGTIEEVYFRPGEVVNAGQAVVALLPPGNLKVRFFVQEPVRAALHLDQTVRVTCDGCKGELTAKISFIAREGEFTPPVIFSREQREKLVFLVEARPIEATGKLTAGQPVTVSLAGEPHVVQR